MHCGKVIMQVLEEVFFTYSTILLKYDEDIQLFNTLISYQQNQIKQTLTPMKYIFHTITQSNWG